MRAAAVLLAAVAGTAAVVIVMNRREARADPIAVPVPPQPAATAPASVADPAAPAPVTAGDEPDDRLELPDGTSVATLNGATGALSLASSWGTRPWSPIVRVERSDAGVDWYVHEDGTRSTTEMKWRPDLGRLDAMVRIGVPQANTPPVKSTKPIER